MGRKNPLISSSDSGVWDWESVMSSPSGVQTLADPEVLARDSELRGHKGGGV